MFTSCLTKQAGMNISIYLHPEIIMEDLWPKDILSMMK